jgi:hypothetical protein
MPDASTGQPDPICGVDRKLVETFLELIRDNYKKADAASLFLEQRTGKANVYGITNLRDVLSHLATLLNSGTPEEKRQEQLTNAEEHLRRAVVEPYETALNTLTVQFDDLYEKYKRDVLPVQDRFPGLQAAPNTGSIEAQLEEVRGLTSNGRLAKAKNLWDPEWEVGVASFIEGYKKLADLHRLLEEYCFKQAQLARDEKNQAELVSLRQQLEDQGAKLEAARTQLDEQGSKLQASSKRGTILTIWGLIATVLLGALGIWVSVVR